LTLGNVTPGDLLSTQAFQIVACVPGREIIKCRCLSFCVIPFFRIHYLCHYLHCI